MPSDQVTTQTSDVQTTQSVQNDQTQVNKGLISQDQIIPGGIKQQHLAASSVIAKGDLYYGDGGNNFVRLPAGVDGQTLKNVSGVPVWSTVSTPTYIWSDWTPTINGTTKGNGAVSARYTQVGKLVAYNMVFVLGNTSAITGFVNFNLPLPQNASLYSTSVSFLRSGSAWYQGFGAASAGWVYIFAIGTAGAYATEADLSAAVPWAWTTNDSITVTGIYETT